MLSLLTPKVILGIIVSLLLSALIWGFNNYMDMRAKYNIAVQEIRLLKHSRQVMDEVAVTVEKKQSENYKRQHKALLEMDQKGYLSTNDNDNPGWLQPSATGN